MVLMCKPLNLICAKYNIWNALNLIPQIIIEHLLTGEKGLPRIQITVARAKRELNSSQVSEETHVQDFISWDSEDILANETACFWFWPNSTVWLGPSVLGSEREKARELWARWWHWLFSDIPSMQCCFLMKLEFVFFINFVFLVSFLCP